MIALLTYKQNRYFDTLIILFFLSVFITACSSPEPENEEVELFSNDELTESLEISTDDLPAMLERRIIRVLVSYNQTNFFVVGGVKKGLEYELMNKFEAYVNKNLRRNKLDVHVVFLAVPFSQLLQNLVDGKGDIVAAGLTVTAARQEEVAFSRPYIKNVKEIVVASTEAAKIKKAQDLSGKKVIVINNSSYIEHLQRLNKQLGKQKLAPVKIEIADPNLVTEDLLQMVNAGIYPYTIADSHIAELWSSTLSEIKLKKSAVINEGGEIAWAVRKNNPELLDILNKFARKHQQGTLLGNILIQRYYQDTKWVENPLTEKRKQQLDKYLELFKKYAAQYQFDWHFLAALAFQESKLSQSAKSHTGAVGIMQIKPSTAADKNINIQNVETSAEQNVHAGTKYLAFLRDRYFADEPLEPFDQFAFIAAAYNAGPAKIRQLRQQAKANNLNPNKWFDNVEYMAKRSIGNETVQYVANIYKYYISYNSIQQALLRREKAIEEIR
ncbi:transglycosylase SLT domain-containing protein [Kaarinaea lacus]